MTAAFKKFLLTGFNSIIARISVMNHKTILQLCKILEMQVTNLQTTWWTKWNFLKAVFLKFYLVYSWIFCPICNALSILVLFVQFKKHEKYPCRSVTFSKVTGFACNFTKSNTLLWMFFTLFKLYKWYLIAQNVSYLNKFIFASC